MLKILILIACMAGSSAAFATSQQPAPELSGGAAATGIMLLIGGVLLFVDWKNGKGK